MRLLFLAGGLDGEERLAILDRLPVLDKNSNQLAGHVRFNFVHELHRFDNAEHLTGFNRIAHFDENIRTRAGSGVERAHDGRFNRVQIGFWLRGLRWRLQRSRL